MDLGGRLKAERERLGFNQTDFAALAGASKHSQISWEKGNAAPNAIVLSTWATHGVDVLYVLTGQHSWQQKLPSDEQMVLDCYRNLSAAKKRTLLASLLTGDIGKGAGISITGSGNRTAGRDYNE